GNYMPITYQPDLSGYYNRSQVDSITSALAPKDSVFSKEEANGLFMSIDHQIDLSSYYTRYESDAITSNFAVREYVYSKSECNQLFKPLSWMPDLSPYALKTDLGDFALKTDLDEIGFAFFTKQQSDERYMPITYTPEEVDLSPYVLRTTADELYKPLSYEPDSNVWALKSDLLDFLPFPLAQQLYYERNDIDARLSNYWLKSETDGIYVQPSALTSYWTKTESNALYLQPSALGNYYTKGDSDARYLRVGDPLLAGGSVALQYNTLFLGMLGDSNHYISHGLSSLAAPSYGNDGPVVEAGSGGGILGQGGQTALRWLNNVITIPGTLRVTGKVDIAEVSIPPKNLSDTRPAFEIQAYMHDNVNILFDTASDGKASFGSFFRIQKFNNNLWVGGGTGAIGNVVTMQNFIQMSPSGLITLSNSSADCLTVLGGLKVNGAIYSGGNKVATEAFVSASKPWESKNSIELNSDATTDSVVYIDLHASPSDYSLRILRNAGANGSALIEQLGTSPLTITAPQATALILSPTDNNPVATGGSIIFGSSVRHDSAVAINGFVAQTQSNGYKCLDLYGVAAVPSTTSANVSLFCQYAVVSRTYFTHSDSRWKQNIRPVPHLDAFDKIDAHLYDWIDPTHGQDQIGFVAQEVLEYLPECVRSLPTENQDDDPPLTVDYQAMSCYLWQVVKTLKNELKEIKDLLRVK
ncbi:hypothetical protein HK104_004377, partial [Borealophlyctis nickersoniae]